MNFSLFWLTVVLNYSTTKENPVAAQNVVYALLIS